MLNNYKLDKIKNAKSFLDREFKNWDKIDNKEFNEMIREKYMLKNETTNKKTNITTIILSSTQHY